MSRVTGTTYQAIVGEVIVQIRKENELSQAELAEKIGTSQSAWSRVEKGQSNLSLSQLVKVAETLGVNPTEIIRRADVTKLSLENDGLQVADNKSDANGWLLLGAAAVALAILTSKK